MSKECFDNGTMRVFLERNCVKYTNNHDVIAVKTSRKQARLAGDKYYIGKLCSSGHKVKKENGSSAEFSLRYSCGSGCVICGRAQRVGDSDHSDTKATKRRRLIEDIELARELGIDIDELS